MNKRCSAGTAVLLLTGAWAGNAQEPASNIEAPIQTIITPEIIARAAETKTNGLIFNFRNAPLDLVLDYLSAAAGFIIHKEADAKGSFDFSSKDSLGKEEALSLINS